jgi:16S rRNA (guanine527-N7)-methyltransferase
VSLPAPVRARLAGLAERHGLSPASTERLGIFLEELADDEHAPTTVRDPARAVDVHVADSLAALDVEQLRSASRIADLGAGAGVPGLILAAALPEARVTLVESVGRKCAFMDRVAAAMGLDNADVLPARAETWAEGLDACDAVTARALAPLPVLVEYAAPLLQLGGALVAWKGTPEPAEEADGEAAARMLGMEFAERWAIEPFEGAERHSLYVYVKVRSTPNGYPRRAGIARKRPLRAST